jgi:hypothetical protein
MAVISGKDGTITIDAVQETPVHDWTLETSANIDKYGANDTSGWKKGVVGVKDSTGAFNMSDLPSVNEGDKVTFVGYTDQDIYTVDVIIERIRVNVDMNDGTRVGWNITFTGNGAVVKTTGSYSP